MQNYGNFRNRGFEITALFDKNKDLIGKKTVNGTEIRDISTIIDYVKNENIEIVALALPKGPATDIAEKLVECGSEGILEFCSHWFRI